MKSTEKKSKPHYVDNKKFYEEILKHKAAVAKAREEGKEDPRLPNYIGECIYKIATKLSYKPCFMNYSFRDEMIDDGIENCIMYFKDFDPDRYQNPFAYFTQIIYYAFLRRIAKEEKNRYTTYKYFQETMINSGVAEVGMEDFDMSGETANLIPKKMYDNISDFMDRFEKKEIEKKNKRKELKGLQKFYEEEENEGEPKSTVSG
jgi:hypothetical protein